MTEKKNEKQNNIRVIICRPGERAVAADIGTDLKSMQKIVGGNIEEYMPFTGSPEDENVAIICNEEGKMNRLTPCRAITDDDGHIMDIIVGSIFICYAPIESETFESLPPALEEKYLKKYGWPHQFFITDHGVEVCQYQPGLFGKEYVVMDER